MTPHHADPWPAWKLCENMPSAITHRRNGRDDGRRNVSDHYFPIVGRPGHSFRYGKRNSLVGIAVVPLVRVLHVIFRAVLTECAWGCSRGVWVDNNRVGRRASQVVLAAPSSGAVDHHARGV
jgi:hypothetical protein